MPFFTKSTQRYGFFPNPANIGWKKCLFESFFDEMEILK